MLAGSVPGGRSNGGGGEAPLLELRWLGGREIRLGGAPIHLESAKTEALLSWVVLNRGSHPRARLVALLWPELSEGRASAALRRALWDLRRKLAPGGGRFLLRVTRGDVELDAEVATDLDVRLLVEASGKAPGGAVEEARLEAAVALYRGELLEGLAVEDAPAFEEWLLGERESLRLLVLSALRRLVTALRSRGETTRALGHARRLLALDPWMEEGHRSVAELLAETGRRGAAIRQLEACRRVLADELGTAPGKETVALEKELRGERRSAPSSRTLEAPRNNLPLAVAPFVGRAREMEAIRRQLADPDCRLLTLLGPGGVGKTRLAVQVASRLAAAGGPFPDGVVFVGPASSPEGSGLAGAFARALELEGGDRNDPEARVLAALRDLRLLIILDGFESRLPEATFLGRLLAEARDVVFLVSSRERLSVAGEWVFEVGGLEAPPRGATPEPARYDALRLFLSTARRGRVGLDPSASDLEAAAEVCRVVGGLPLAIEVAAGWVRALSPGEVAAQLARGPGLLAFDVPQGQGTSPLRRVFEEAVARLDPEERRVLRALSVFAGGTTWEGAIEVGRTKPETIRVLVDRSFLRLEGSTGRYALHEVLRAFAAEELASSREEEAEVGQRLAARVASFLSRQREALVERAEKEARDTLASDLKNVRAAWARAVRDGDTVFLAAALGPLAAAHRTWGSWREGEGLADEAVRAGVGAAALVARASFRIRLGDPGSAEADLNETLRRHLVADDPLRAEALLHVGHAGLLRGRFAEARAALEACIALARARGQPRVLSEALGRLGRAVLDEGRHEEARGLFEESLAVAKSICSTAAVLYATNQLGLVEYFAGDLEEAQRRLSLALTLARAEGNRPGAVSALQGLGFVAEDRGELDAAAAFYREGLAAARANGDRYAAGRCLMVLGEVERKRGAGGAARTYYEEALDLARAVGSAFLAGLLAGNLAYLAAAEGRSKEAVRHARSALAAFRETGSFTVGLPALVALAEVAAFRGEGRLALELLGHVLAHPGNRQDHRLEVERVLARLRREQPRLDVEAGLEAGRARRFEELAQSALAEPDPGSRSSQARGRK